MRLEEMTGELKHMVDRRHMLEDQDKTLHQEIVRVSKLHKRAMAETEAAVRATNEATDRVRRALDDPAIEKIPEENITSDNVREKLQMLETHSDSIAACKNGLVESSRRSQDMLDQHLRSARDTENELAKAQQRLEWKRQELDGLRDRRTVQQEHYQKVLNDQHQKLRDMESKDLELLHSDANSISNLQSELDRLRSKLQTMEARHRHEHEDQLAKLASFKQFTEQGMENLVNKVEQGIAQVHELDRNERLQRDSLNARMENTKAALAHMHI